MPVVDVSRRTLLRAGAALVAGGCGPRAAPTPCRATRTILVDAAVMQGDRFVSDRAIVIEGDRIREIVARARLGRLRADDGVVALPGAFVLPGLVDAHAHPPDSEPDDAMTMAESLALWLSAGVTTVRSCRGTLAQIELRDAIAAGSIVGPRLRVGGVIDAVDPGDGARQVAAVAAAGYDFVKLLGCADDATHAAIAGAARAAGLQVTGHVPDAVGLAQVIARGQSIEHLDGIRAALAAGAELEVLAASIARAGIEVCATETFLVRAWQLAEPTRWEDLPTVARVSAEQRRRWRAWAGARSIAADERAAAAAAHDRDLEILAALDRAQVRLRVSPSHGPWIVPGWSMRDELEIFAAAGISPAAALVHATRPLAGRAGLGPGAPADLAIVDGDPHRELAALHRIRAVMAAGRWVVGPVA